MTYRERIKQICPLHNARHIEAYMRLEHSTLDGLSKHQFSEEVQISATCVREAGPLAADRLAQSFGL